MYILVGGGALAHNELTTYFWYFTLSNARVFYLTQDDFTHEGESLAQPLSTSIFT